MKDAVIDMRYANKYLWFKLSTTNIGHVTRVKVLFKDNCIYTNDKRQREEIHLLLITAFNRRTDDIIYTHVFENACMNNYL